MKRKKAIESEQLLKTAFQTNDIRLVSIAFALLSLMAITEICDRITSQPILGNIVLAFWCFSLVSLMIYLFWQRQRKTRVSFSGEIKAPNGARGLILLVSPFNPRSNDPEIQKKMTETFEKILSCDVSELTDDDFNAIQIKSSNMKPQIKAVEYHYNQDKLSDVWLITSKTEKMKRNGRSYDIRGSENAGKVLQKYLLHKYGSSSIKVHIDGLSVGSLDYHKLQEIVNDIFVKADYKSDCILADITGGNKVMTIALGLACIEQGRCMEYMEAGRDWKGDPTDERELSPVLIDIDPIIQMYQE